MKIKRISSAESHWVIELFDKYRVFYNHPSDMVLAKQFIQERLDHHESAVFVALMDDNNKTKPVGFTQLYPKYSSVQTVKNWILNDLFVEAEYRKQGIGEKLIRTAMLFAKAHHAKIVELSTAVDNHRAQRLYEQIGFEKQNPDDSFLTYKINLN